MVRKHKKTAWDKAIKVLIIVLLSLGAVYMQIKLVSILDELKVDIFGSEVKAEILLPELTNPSPEVEVIEEAEPEQIPEPETIEKTIVIEKVIEVPVEVKTPKPLPGSIFQD